MFIFVQPMYSKQELNGDSNYVHYAAMIEAMLVVRPTWHFFVAFPDKESGYKYKDDGFFKLPNVTRVPQHISPRKLSNAISFDGFWFDMLFRQIGFDAIWCNLVESAGNIKHMGTGSYEAVGRPYIFAAHHYIIHDSLPYPFHSLEHVAMAQIMGAHMADYNIFNSEHCRKMFVETAGKYLLPELIDGIVERSTLIGLGTLEQDFEFSPTENEVPVIAYNHRLQAYKNFLDTFAILDELHKEGIKFKVKFMGAAAENLTKIQGYPFVEVRLAEARQDYLVNLRGCDLNVSNSQHETFCIAAVESMALGQPLVAPDGVTFPEITGARTNGYPYLFKNATEQKEMLRKLLTDKAERLKWGKVVSDHVCGNYKRIPWAIRHAELFEEKVITQLNSPDDAVAMFTEILQQNSGVSVPDFFLAVQKGRCGGRQPFSSQSMPLTKLIKMVRHIGGTVRMFGGKQCVFKL